MKNLIIILLFIPIVSFAQHYVGITEIPNKTADQLYCTAKEWFTKNVKSFDDTIQTDEQLGKKIIAKGKRQIEYPCKNGLTHMDIYFTIITEFKDKEFKNDIFSTKLQVIKGLRLTYDLLKNSTTVKGYRAILNANGIKTSGMIIIKHCKDCNEFNKMVIDKVEAQIHGVVDDLMIALNHDH